MAGHRSVKGRGGSAALEVAQHRHASFEAGPSLDFRSDGDTRRGTLGNDD